MKLSFAFLFTVFLGIVNSSAQDRDPILVTLDSLVEEARYAEALLYLDEIAKKGLTPSTLAVLQNKRAEIFVAQGHLAEADQLLDQILTHDPFIDAITLSNKGLVNLNKGRYDLAIKYFRDALATFQATGKSQSVEAIQCLTRLSSVYLTTGRYKQAEEHELLALQLRQTVFGTGSEYTASSYNNLGLIYLSTDPSKALEYYEKALGAYTNLHSAHHPKIAISHTNLGIAYLQLELYGDAINHFDDAKIIWDKIYPSGHPNVALVLRNLGRTYSRLKDYKASVEYYQQAIGLYEKAYGLRHPDIAGTLTELATVQLNESNYALALDYIQRSLIANTQTFDKTAISENPRVSDYYNPTVLVYSLTSKARILEAQYIAKTMKLEDLKLALRCLYLCDSLFDDMRHKYVEESDKLTLGALANDVYEDGVRIAVLISENVMNATPYLQQAFYFSEKSKAAVLLASIVDSQAKAFGGIPAQLLEEERNIKSAITLLHEKLSQKPDEENERALRSKLFDTNNQYDRFIHTLEQQYPNYYNLKYRPVRTEIQDLQQTLDGQTAILSYFIGDTSNTLYIFSISQGTFTVASRSLSKDFYRNLKGLQNSIVFYEPVIFKKTSLWLSKLLIPHFAPDIKKLIIIPSGKLSLLPFEVLLTKKSKGADFADAPFLVKQFSISYEFSAGLIVQEAPLPPVTSPSIFLCAPVTFSEGLADLPATEDEVTRIATIFSPRSKVALKDFATEREIKYADLTKFDYLHFATHGTADEQTPGLSKLFLNASDTEDGSLYAGEIFNLNLQARLAVLSACETGLGKLSKGEGVIGLSRALSYAGASNVVVSFWSVADESTAMLMEDFYRFLLSHKSDRYSDALRASKLKMIQSQTYSAPYYWAPFILIGR